MECPLLENSMFMDQLFLLLQGILPNFSIKVCFFKVVMRVGTETPCGPFLKTIIYDLDLDLDLDLLILTGVCVCWGGGESTHLSGDW